MQRSSIAPMATLTVAPLVASVLAAVLTDSRCPCGTVARRIVAERKDVRDAWRGHDRVKRAKDSETLVVRAWCGATDDDHVYGDASSHRSLDSDALALTEDDL